MIEQHFGHVNTIKHADRVLQGMSGWEPMINNLAYSDGTARASAGAGGDIDAVSPLMFKDTSREWPSPSPPEALWTGADACLDLGDNRLALR